eukprot:scaffold116068_cov69-Phaeocystis_antarctica.AAC.7
MVRYTVHCMVQYHTKRGTARLDAGRGALLWWTLCGRTSAPPASDTCEVKPGSRPRPFCCVHWYGLPMSSLHRNMPPLPLL